MLGVIGRLGIKERSCGQRCSLASPPPTLDSPRLVFCSSLPTVVHRDLHHSNPICGALPKNVAHCILLQSSALLILGGQNNSGKSRDKLLRFIEPLCHALAHTSPREFRSPKCVPPILPSMTSIWSTTLGSTYCLLFRQNRRSSV